MLRIAVVLGMMMPGAFVRGAPASSPRKPNILVILVDDLGYADLGCQGSKQIITPNIDSLAANGMRFTSGYVSCPVCSPTRAGLMTGRYQQRFGHEFNPGTSVKLETIEGLPLSEKTIADDLKGAGYATGLVGKWHLGMQAKFHPNQRGFDEFFGFLGGMHDYIDLMKDPKDPIYRNRAVTDEKEYLTDAFNREAVSFIERHKDGPFFLYLAYNAVHLPLEVPDSYMRRNTQIWNLKRRKMAAMLTAADDGVGMILAKLRELKLEEDTLIFFLSDNGGPTPVNTSLNTPFSGFKADINEGAIRIPFIVQWKGKVPPGVVRDNPIIALDIRATADAAASAKCTSPKPLDGVNLLPLLKGESTADPHEMLFWRYGQFSAVRKGNYKLLREHGKPDELFDLVADPGEAKDLSKEQPKIAADLSAALAGFHHQLMNPLWPEPPRKRDKAHQ